MRLVRWSLVALALGAPQAVAGGEVSPARANVRFIEDSLTLTRPSEAARGEASPNLPLMEGDELASGGRAELGLPDGTLVFLDADTWLDVVALEPAALLRLRQGGLIVHRPAAAPDAGAIRIDTPAGTALLFEAGRYRTVVGRDGTTHVAVESGLAEVASDRSSVLVHDGERTSVFPGDEPGSPYLYNTAVGDRFTRFVDARIAAVAVQLSYQREEVDLPAPILPYRAELSRYGTWRALGPGDPWVWTPNVTASWQPYLDGRWASYPDGLTWVSSEPWGFVTYHYGSWDFAPSFGWYWRPGAVYAPAWVDWVLYDDHIGWCPRGYAGHRHGYGGPPRVVRDHIERPGHTVVIRRDLLFQKHLRDIAVPADRLKLTAPLRVVPRLELSEWKQGRKVGSGSAVETRPPSSIGPGAVPVSPGATGAPGKFGLTSPRPQAEPVRTPKLQRSAPSPARPQAEPVRAPKLQRSAPSPARPEAEPVRTPELERSPAAPGPSDRPETSFPKANRWQRTSPERGAAPVERSTPRPSLSFGEFLKRRLGSTGPPAAAPGLAASSPAAAASPAPSPSPGATASPASPADRLGATPRPDGRRDDRGKYKFREGSRRQK